jgi:predicted Zn-dependent peptidase
MLNAARTNPTRPHFALALAQTLALAAVIVPGWLAHAREPQAAEPPPAPAPPIAATGERGLDDLVSIEIARRANVYTVQLANGVVAHLRPMPAEGRVRLAVCVMGGEVLEGPGERGFTRAAAAAWSFNTEEADRAGLQVSRSAWAEGFLLSVIAPKANAVKAMDLAGSMLERPVIDPDRLQAWRGSTRLILEKRRLAPIAQVTEATFELLAPPDDPRVAPITPAVLEAITPELAQGWLRRCLSAGPIEVSLVGDFELADALPALARAFGGIAPRAPVSPEAFRAERTPGTARPPGPLRQSITLDDRAQERAVFVIVGYAGPDTRQIDEVRPLHLACEALRPGVERALHEAGVNTKQLRLTAIPGRQFLGLGLIMASAELAPSATPAQAEHAAQVLRDAIESAARHGPPESDLAQAREVLAADAGRRLAEPEYWCRVLPVSLYHGHDLDRLADAERAYTTMTREQVDRALRRWIIPEGRFELLALPARQE